MSIIKIEELYPIAAESQLAELTSEELALTGGSLIGVSVLNGSLNGNKILSGNFSGNSYNGCKEHDYNYGCY